MTTFKGGDGIGHFVGWSAKHADKVKIKVSELDEDSEPPIQFVIFETIDLVPWGQEMGMKVGFPNEAGDDIHTSDDTVSRPEVELPTVGQAISEGVAAVGSTVGEVVGTVAGAAGRGVGEGVGAGIGGVGTGLTGGKGVFAWVIGAVAVGGGLLAWAWYRKTKAKET